jgi:hypothetical protein
MATEEILKQDKLNKLLLLYKLLVSNDRSINFMELGVLKTAKLIKSNLTLVEGIKYLQKYLPRISNKEIYLNYDIPEGCQGNESLILFKEGDDDWIYKVNDPLRKVDSEESDFNEYIFNFLLNDFFFPEARYSDFRINGTEVFMRQKFFDPIEPTKSQIRSMIQDGFKESYYIENIEGYATKLELDNSGIENLVLMIYDLFPKNCRIYKNKVVAFDAKYKLI